MSAHTYQLKKQAEMANQTDQDYLKAILLIHIEKGEVRQKDLAAELGKAESSVRAAVIKLAERGYTVANDARGAKIVFTSEGRALAEKILARHQKIHGWLLRLGVPEKEADDQACAVEHVISDNTIASINRHVKMALKLFGADATYPEKMQEIASQLSGAEVASLSSTTRSQEILHTIEQYGGLERLTKLADLSDKIGGEAALEQISAFVQTIGGSEKAMIFAQQCKSSADLDGALELISQPKKCEHMRKAAQAVDQMGGLENASRINRMAKKVGGLPILLEIVNVGQRMQAIFKREKS